MFFDADAQVLIDNLGWVDGGAIWTFDLRTATEKHFRIEGARYLTIRSGEQNLFRVTHHGSSDRAISTRHAGAPQTEIASIDVGGQPLSVCMLPHRRSRLEIGRAEISQSPNDVDPARRGRCRKAEKGFSRERGSAVACLSLDGGTPHCALTRSLRYRRKATSPHWHRAGCRTARRGACRPSRSPHSRRCGAARRNCGRAPPGRAPPSSSCWRWSAPART